MNKDLKEFRQGKENDSNCMGDVVHSPEQVICIDCLNRELNKVEAENQRLKKQIAEKNKKIGVVLPLKIF